MGVGVSMVSIGDGSSHKTSKNDECLKINRYKFVLTSFQIASLENKSQTFFLD